MFKELSALKGIVKKSGMFFGGVAFGSVGLKALSSKEAKELYSKSIVVAFKVKDQLDTVVSTVKQHSDDILAQAKDMYEEEKKATYQTMDEEVAN